MQHRGAGSSAALDQEEAGTNQGAKIGLKPGVLHAVTLQPDLFFRV